MSNTEHFYVLKSACDASGKQSALEAIKWVVQHISTKKMQDTTVWCVFETKQQIISSEFQAAIDHVLGQGTSKKLAKGDVIQLEKGNNIRCVYKTKLPSYPDGIVLNFWCTGKTLDTIDSWKGVSAVITVTWDDNSYRDWISTWSATEILGNNLQVPTIPLDPVLEKALQTLSRGVTRQSSVGHPNDEKSCEDLFILLKQRGISFDGNSVKAYCLQNNWSPSGANKVKAIAEKINRRKSISQTQKSWSSAIIEEWFN